MIHKLHKKRLSTFLLLFICFFTVFAQSTSLSQIYSAINNYVDSKNKAAVNQVLLNNKTSKNLSKIEQHILFKAREQLVFNNLDFAMDLCYLIIENNMDNFDAVDLYSSIERTKKTKEEKERKAKEQAQLEAIKKATAEAIAKREAEKEALTTAIAQRDTQKTPRTQAITQSPSGQKVYLNQDADQGSHVFTWLFGVGGADISFLINLPQKSDIFYGVAAMGNWFYKGDYIAIGLDAFASMAFVSFSDIPFMPVKAEGSVNLGFPAISKYLYLRGGIASLWYYFDQESLYPIELLTPTFGFALRDIGAEFFLFDFHFDYHATQFFYSPVTTSFSLGLNFYIRFADLKKVDIGFILGAEDTFVLINQGMRNHAKVNIGIGVWDNE